MSIIHHELFNAHVPSSDSDNQLPIDDLRKYLPRSKHVLIITQPLNGHRTVQLINIVCKQLIYNISLVRPVPFLFILPVYLCLGRVILLLALPHPLADLLELLDHGDDLLLDQAVGLEQVENVGLACDLGTLLVRRVLDYLVIEFLLGFLSLLLSLLVSHL